MAIILKDLSADALVAAIENNLHATWNLVGGTPHANIENDNAVMRLRSGVPSPLCNGVFRARFEAESADAEIDAALSPFRSRKMPMIWWTGPSSRPSDLGQRLENRGLVHAGESPGMAADLELIDDKPPVPPELHIRSVATVRVLKDWLAAFEAGFEMSRAAARFFFDVFGSIGPEYRLPARHYVAYLGEEPVACSSMFLLAGVAGIYNVATVPDARGLGIGAAVATAPLIRARAEGYRVAILHATEAGLGVYRRLGFREYCTIGQYVWEPETLPATATASRLAPNPTSPACYASPGSGSWPRGLARVPTEIR